MLFFVQNLCLIFARYLLTMQADSARITWIICYYHFFKIFAQSTWFVGWQCNSKLVSATKLKTSSQYFRSSFSDQWGAGRRGWPWSAPRPQHYIHTTTWLMIFEAARVLVVDKGALASAGRPNQQKVVQLRQLWKTCTTFFQRRNSIFESRFKNKNTIWYTICVYTT